LAKAVANSTKDLDFELDEKRREINLTEIGYEKTKAKLGKNFIRSRGSLMLEILNALKAKHIFKLNKDYIVLKIKY
jgi:preprotein translocase subunit SecA